MDSSSISMDELRDRSDHLAGEGKHQCMFPVDGKLSGIIAVADIVKKVV